MSRRDLATPSLSREVNEVAGGVETLVHERGVKVIGPVETRVCEDNSFYFPPIPITSITRDIISLKSRYYRRPTVVIGPQALLASRVSLVLNAGNGGANQFDFLAYCGEIFFSDTLGVSADGYVAVTRE